MKTSLNTVLLFNFNISSCTCNGELLVLIFSGNNCVVSLRHRLGESELLIMYEYIRTSSVPLPLFGGKQVERIAAFCVCVKGLESLDVALRR